MGLFATILDQFSEQCSAQSVYVVAGLGFLTLVVLSVLTNVLVQLVFKNPNEPPVVFHWFPFIGSTVTYGMDPYKFFFDARKKVRSATLFFKFNHPTNADTPSMAIFSPSSCWERKPRCFWVQRATTSS
jgi:hypothetical protein